MTQPTSPAGSHTRTVFYSVAAQWDNLGDIEIRNTALAWILSSGSDVIAFTGGMPASYIESFRTDGRVRWISSAGSYQLALWSHILRRRASIVFAPGPQVFSPRLKPMAKSLVNLLNTLGVRASGGAVLAAGRSLRGKGRLAKVLESRVIATFHLYVVRDTRSTAVLGRTLRNAPDLGFENLGTEPDKQRNLAVISLRGDRPIDKVGLGRLVEVLKGRGLAPVFLTQVKRDDTQHAALAEQFGVPALLWGDRTHHQQLEVARSTYESTRVVISNRLHALILGIQQGAAPFAVLDAGSDKLLSTLEPWIAVPSTTPDFATAGGEDWATASLGDYGDSLVRATDAARLALTDVRDEFVTHLTSRGGGVLSR